MKNFIITTLLALGFAAHAAVPTPGADVQLLENPGFEKGLSTWSKTGSSTLTQIANAPGYAARWDASASGEFLRSKLYTVPDRLKNKPCTAYVHYKWASGTAGNIKVGVHDGTSYIAQPSDVQIQAASDWTIYPIQFTCPSSGSFRIQLESYADAAAIDLDDALLGKSLATQVSQASIYGTLNYAGVTNCTWSSTSATTASYGADTDCNAPTVTGKASAPATKIPAITFASMDPGMYEINVNGFFLGDESTAGQQNCRWEIYDGSSSANEVYQVIESVSKGNVQFNDLRGYFNYTSAQANKTLEIRVKRVTGNATCDVRARSSDEPFTITVKRYPLNSSESYNYETSGWRVDAQIGGANASLGTSTIATYTEIVDAGLTLTNASGMNVLTAQVPCSTTNAPTGTTCAAGSESLGVSFTLPAAGDVKACASFSHITTLTASAPGNVYDTFQLIETPNNAQTLTQLGKSRVQSGGTMSTASGDRVRPERVCGTFTFSSAGQKTIRLMYTQSGVSNVSTNAIMGDASSNVNVHFTVEPMNQGAPSPVFDSYTKKVNGNVSGLRIEAVAVESACGSSPCTITRQTGSWLTNITRSATGTYAVNFSPAFTSAPTCVVAAGNFNTLGLCAINGATTTTSTPVFCRNTSTGAGIDGNFNVFCYGVN